MFVIKYRRLNVLRAMFKFSMLRYRYHSTSILFQELTRQLHHELSNEKTKVDKHKYLNDDTIVGMLSNPFILGN